MRLKIIACKVLTRELYYIAYSCKNTVDIRFISQSLHDTPEKLNKRLQEVIDETETEDEKYDAICLGYGLCSNATAGLWAKNTPLVIPKAHDCISLLVGDRKKFKSIFDRYNGGVYWYTNGWIENSNENLPSREKYKALYEKYCEKFDEDNAEYLVEMEKQWLKAYEAMIFIDWKQFDNSGSIEKTKDAAKYLDFKFENIQGSEIILKNMLEGIWDNNSFLIVPPGMTVIPSYDDEIIKCSKSAFDIDRSKVMTNEMPK